MTVPERLYTPAEYLDFENSALDKHEYLDGRIYAMSGVTANHNRITVALVASLGNQLRDGPCEPFTTGMRLRVSATGLYTYPDASAVHDEPMFEEYGDADGPDGVLELPSVGAVLRLADLYERVEFPVHPPGPRRVREPDPVYAADPAFA